MAQENQAQEPSTVTTMFGDFTVAQEEAPVVETPTVPVIPAVEDDESNVDDLSNTHEDDEKTPEQIAEEAEAADTPETQEEGAASGYDSIINTLEDNGALYLEEGKQYDDTEEGVSQMLLDNMAGYKAMLDAEHQTRLAELSAAGEEIVSYKDFDLDKPGDVDQVLGDYYKDLGLTEEESAARLATMGSNEEVKRAEASLAKRALIKREAEVIAAKAIETQAELDKTNKKANEYVDGIKAKIASAKEFAGFELTPELRTEFSEYLFKVGTDGKTQAQRADSDEDRRTRIAFLDFMDFNKSKFEIKVKTELAKTDKKRASRFTSKGNKVASGKGARNTKQSTAITFPDFFGGANTVSPE